MVQALPMERAKVVFQGVEGAYSFAAMKNVSSGRMCPASM